MIEVDAIAFTIASIQANAKQFRFANAFACNDAVSFDLLWREHADDVPAVALLNHRNDRPLRSLQFLDYFARLPTSPRVLLLGGTPWLRRAARHRKLDVRAIAGLPWIAGRVLLERVAAEIPDGAVVWGVGNYHGRGAAIVKALKAEVPCSP